MSAEHEPTQIPDKLDPPSPAARSTTPPVIEMPEAVGDTVSVQSLRGGMRLAHELYDERGDLLLPAGSRITPRFLAALKRRGIRRIKLRPAAASASVDDLRGVYEKQLDELLAGAARDPQRGSDWGHRQTTLSVEELGGEANAGLGRHTDAGNLLEDIAGRLTHGGSESAAALTEVVDDFLNMVALDADLLPTIVSLQEPQNEYLYDHCVNVSLLSITTAMQLGLPREKVMELAVGTMLQDVGMLVVPDSIRLAPRALTPDERVQIRKHPVHTLDNLERMEGIAPIAVFVGYQVHERMDGSGYPRGRAGMFIHQYARIAAVSDVFSAMTRPRPHRPAHQPYEAMREVLWSGYGNKLDRGVIRAFLDSMSLFPVGSFVELNEKIRAKVVRAHPGLHTRPMVVEVNDRFQPTGQVIDLAVDTRYHVVRVVPQSGACAPAAPSDSSGLGPLPDAGDGGAAVAMQPAPGRCPTPTSPFVNRA